MPAAAAAAPAGIVHRDAMNSLWVLRIAFGSFCIAVWVGLPWDFYWHTSRLFENFASPPHFVIYGGSAAAVAPLAYVVRSPSLAAPFGATFPLPFLRLAPPRSLLLFGGGRVVIGLAGIVGPFVLFSTPYEVQGLFARPGFVAVVTQHLLVIITNFGLTRTNPAYPVLLAVWVGVGLRVAASLDPR